MLGINGHSATPGYAQALVCCLQNPSRLSKLQQLHKGLCDMFQGKQETIAPEISESTADKGALAAAGRNGAMDNAAEDDGTKEGAKEADYIVEIPPEQRLGGFRFTYPSS